VPGPSFCSGFYFTQGKTRTALNKTGLFSIQGEKVFQSGGDSQLGVDDMLSCLFM